MRIILASKSPRRKELMNLLDINYEVIVSTSEEKIDKNLAIYEQSKALAYEKAKSVFDTIEGNKVVIGSDTIVVKNDKIYGKPVSEDDAFYMIKELQNDTHEVITSLCILVENNEHKREYIDLDITRVHVCAMNDEEIIDWIKTGHAMDKARSLWNSK